MKISNPYSIGYFSNYSRGLIHLLQLWPAIHRAFPVATLSICYGREHWGTCHPNDFKFIIDSIQKYKHMGVIELGKVGHIHLARIMQQTSIWAYPCISEAETFCITAIKAQLAGMIPVTTRVGALRETIHPDAPSIPAIKCRDDIIRYGDLLIQTLARVQRSDPLNLQHERSRYVQFGRQFTWTACVQKWLHFYETMHASQKVIRL